MCAQQKSAIVPLSKQPREANAPLGAPTKRESKSLSSGEHSIAGKYFSQSADGMCICCWSACLFAHQGAHNRTWYTLMCEQTWRMLALTETIDLTARDRETPPIQQQLPVKKTQGTPLCSISTRTTKFICCTNAQLPNGQLDLNISILAKHFQCWLESLGLECHWWNQ